MDNICSNHNLNFTLHNAGINNISIPKSETMEIGRILTPGQYKFMIDCLSTPGQNLGFDHIYVETYMTTHGARLSVEIDNPGIRVISFINNSPDHPNIYRWFFEE